MENSLKIIENIILVVALIYCGTFFWQSKSKNIILCKVTQIGITIVLFALQIPRLVLEVLLNRSYVMTIILLCVWTLILTMNSFILGNMMGEASTSMEFVVKMMDDIIERNQEDCKATNDNQWETKKEKFSFPRKRFLFLF